MATHLGRNPFQKKKVTAQPASFASKDSLTKNRITLDQEQKKHFSDSLLVKIPAESFIFALKTILLVKSVLSGSSENSSPRSSKSTLK